MKLSKEKKLHLGIVAIATIVVIAGLWFCLITAQRDKIAAIARKGEGVQKEIDKVQKVITSAGQMATDLEEATNRLTRIEATMPSGDLFSWIVSTLKQFNVPTYKVEMPQIGVPAVGGVKMFPEFPYNQAAIAVNGTAYYYDIGKFVSDFENHFPYMRVQNLLLDPGPGPTPDEHEKLNFHMEIVTLVKTNSI